MGIAASGVHLSRERHQTPRSEGDCRQQIKTAFDPENVFWHAQSIPVTG
jgi:hypothetical protein